MSRELLLSLSESDAIALCAKENAGISALESLPQGGVRLVCMSAEGAALMRRKLKTHLIKGSVARARHRPISPLW